MLRLVGPQGCSWSHAPPLPVQGTEGPGGLACPHPHPSIQRLGQRKRLSLVPGATNPVSCFSLPWGEAESEGITQGWGLVLRAPSADDHGWAAERKQWPSELPPHLGMGKGCHPLSPQSLWLRALPFGLIPPPHPLALALAQRLPACSWGSRPLKSLISLEGGHGLLKASPQAGTAPWRAVSEPLEQGPV